MLHMVIWDFFVGWVHFKQLVWKHVEEMVGKPCQLPNTENEGNFTVLEFLYYFILPIKSLF